MPRRASAANAVRSVITEYGPDDYGARTVRGLAAWDGRARSGLLAQAVIGESHEPGMAFYGYVNHPVQRFGQGGGGGNALTFRDGENSIDKQQSNEAMNDPALKIFAERLRRRR